MSVKVSIASDPGAGVSVPGWELSLSDSSFSALWTSIGLRAGPSPYQGCLDGRTLAAALASVGEVRVGRVSDPSDLTFGGFTPRQLRRYMERLTDIADEAERRESRVIWS